MRITESRLRRIIRSVIKENYHHDDDVGYPIDRSDINKLKMKFGAQETREANKRDSLELKKDIDSLTKVENVNVIDPDNFQEIKHAERDDPEALLPMFVFSEQYIVFKTVGSHKYYYRSKGQYGSSKKQFKELISSPNYNLHI